jgi:hypothetical protein
MPTEYIIYADESDQRGIYFSNFFGGALIRSRYEEYIITTLTQAKTAQNMFKELKWARVSENYLDKYIAIMDTFFDLVRDRHIKTRIMFTKNSNVAQHLGAYHHENRYYLLYHEFIKHAFGLRYCNPDGVLPIQLKILFDEIPDAHGKFAFKQRVLALNNEPKFRENRIQIKFDAVGDVNSKDHVVLQCLDVILGAIQFRLNDKHKEKLPGSRWRGKRTIAKEKLYKHIRARICEIYPRFNVGVSTSDRGNLYNRWLHPYSHWCFVPSNATYDVTKGKHFDGTTR